jgi:peptidoglycan L-alanyl-D-glutamate endopeptidase CwlK
MVGGLLINKIDNCWPYVCVSTVRGYKMAKFSIKSLDQLKTCHQDLQRVALTAIEHFGFSIVEGHRDKEKQHKYFVDGKSRVDWPNGNHNKIPSNAFDFLPDSVSWDDLNGVNGNKVQEQAVATCYMLSGYLLAIGDILDIPLRSGADWDSDKDLKDQNFNDIVHIERRL